METNGTNTNGSPLLPATPPAPAHPSTLRSIFVGPNGIRAGWRLLIYWLIVVATFFVILKIRHLFVHGHSAPHDGDAMLEAPVPTLIPRLIGFAVLGFGAWIMSRIEKQPWGSYGLPVRRIFSVDFALGLVWGFVGLSAVMLCLWLGGAFVITGLALTGSAIFKFGFLWALAFFAVGLFEEFGFRGYTQYTLATGIGFWPAAIATSFLFFFAHRGNPGETWLGLTDVFLIGLFLCFTWWRTGDLWFAVGLHSAWDWGLSFFYSVPDSGASAAGHLLNVRVQGPAWLSGGTAGPEGSVINVIFDLLCFVIFAFIYRERRFVGMADRRRAMTPLPAPSDSVVLDTSSLTS
jgi:CAAX protease family protein